MRMISLNFKYLFLAISTLFLFTACASSEPQPQNTEVVRDMKVARLTRSLEELGTRTVQTGQTMRVIVSSDRIFNPRSANFSSDASKTLNTLSQLMMLLETTSVEVSGYTDAASTQLQNKALATAQAETVSDYLWSRGVDARLVYSVGYSATARAGSLADSTKNSANRRIEVRFQYLPLLSSLVN